MRSFTCNLYKIAKRLRVNHQIKIPTVRLISGDDEQLGIMGTEKAMAMAKDKGVDLVEVAPKASPPVCKLMDYGKYQYHQKKADQKHKKMQKKSEIKGVRLTLRTDIGALEMKANKARKFVEAGNGLKVQLIFKGREMQHKDLGYKKMEEFKELLKDIAKVDQPAKGQGYTLVMILSPLK